MAIAAVRAEPGWQRWQRAFLYVAGVTLAASWAWPYVWGFLFELAERRSTNVPGWLVLGALWLLRAGQVASVVLALVFWGTLYRRASARGGRGYAWGHTVLSIALGPLGILCVPLLVERDISSGRADWIRATARRGGLSGLYWFTGALGAIALIAALFSLMLP